MHGKPNLTLPQNRSRSTKGHHFTKFVELESLMLQAKFQDPLVSGSEEIFLKVFTIYWCGDHLGHVTETISITFRSPFPWKLDVKLGFDWPSCFRKYITPEQRQASLRVRNFS